jgi:aryl-alcohol dehydrogenase-like predicted oxidoreductase
LRRLDTDVIDLLQIHSASVEAIRDGAVFEVMRRFQEAGHVRFLGVTGGNDGAVAAIEDGHYDTVQIVYNLNQQDARDTVFPLAREWDIGVIVMVPLGHGAFTRKWEYLEPEQRSDAERFRWLERPDQSLASAALRFVLADLVVSTAIPGTRKIANLEANVAASEGRLTDDELTRIRSAVA